MYSLSLDVWMFFYMNIRLMSERTDIRTWCMLIVRNEALCWYHIA